MLQTFPKLLTTSQTLDPFLNDAVMWKGDWKVFSQKWKYREILKILSLQKYKQQLDHILQSFLHAQTHSLAYSYILGFKAGEKMEDTQTLSSFIRQVQTLLQYGDPEQISVFPRPFSDALRVFCDYMKRENPMGLIPILKRAIVVLQGSNKHILTVAHADLAFCAVQTLCYHAALPEIEQDIIQVQKQGAVRPIDNLLYFYYTGLAFVGMKKFSQAMEAFTMVLTAPIEIPSLIQIETYKKYIFVSLIQHKHLVTLPRYAPQGLTRLFPKLCPEYLEISDNFHRGLDVIQKLVEKYTETYTQDNNFGLMKQVLQSLKQNSVRKLTSVYTRLSMERVAELCNFNSLEETKNLLIKMISDGELAATIDAENVVKFEETLSRSDATTLSNIQGRIQNILEIWHALDKSQLEIKRNPQYIKKTLNLSPSGMDQDLQQQLLLESMVGSGGGLYFRM